MPPTDEMDMYIFAGKQIRIRRIIMGLSQRQLAHNTGITLYMIKRYETGEGNITMDKLSTIAKTLDVPIGYFFNNIA